MLISVSVQYHEHFHPIIHKSFLLVSLSVSVLGSVNNKSFDATTCSTVLQINNMNEIFNEVLLISRLTTNKIIVI